MICSLEYKVNVANLFCGTYFRGSRNKLIINIGEIIGKHKFGCEKLEKYQKRWQPKKLRKLKILGEIGDI